MTEALIVLTAAGWFLAALFGGLYVIEIRYRRDLEESLDDAFAGWDRSLTGWGDAIKAGDRARALVDECLAGWRAAEERAREASSRKSE